MPKPKIRSPIAAPSNVKHTFRWIVRVLRKHRVLFHVTGGLAASLYGSPRKFHDIDILIHRSSLPSLLPDIRRYITFGPGQYRDRHFDVFLVALKIYGTEIDLGMDCRIRDHGTGKWCMTPGPTESVRRRIFGQWVQVESKEKLMRIKRILGRKKDLLDIAAMQA